MERYLSEIQIGESRTPNKQGSMLANDEAARDKAIDLLMAIARERLNEGGRREVITRARDESGDVLLVAKLLLVTEWAADPIRAD